MCTFSKTELDFWFFWISFQREGSSLVLWLCLILCGYASFFGGHPQSVSNCEPASSRCLPPGWEYRILLSGYALPAPPSHPFPVLPQVQPLLLSPVMLVRPLFELFFFLHELGSRGHRSEKLGMRIWKRRQCEVSEFYLLLLTGLNRRPGFRDMLSPGNQLVFIFPRSEIDCVEQRTACFQAQLLP